MASTYTKIYIHLIFSTKNREPIIRPEFEDRLKAYMIGIARNFGVRILAINGTTDHMHILSMIPSRMAISKIVQLIKGGSSKWLNETVTNGHKFRWQKGYGAFSVNESMVPTTIRYIRKQKEHHQNMCFDKEMSAILKKHGV